MPGGWSTIGGLHMWASSVSCSLPSSFPSSSAPLQYSLACSFSVIQSCSQSLHTRCSRLRTPPVPLPRRQPQTGPHSQQSRWILWDIFSHFWSRATSTRCAHIGVSRVSVISLLLMTTPSLSPSLHDQLSHFNLSAHHSLLTLAWMCPAPRTEMPVNWIWNATLTITTYLRHYVSVLLSVFYTVLHEFCSTHAICVYIKSKLILL